MESVESESIEPLEQIRRAFRAEDADQVRLLLDRFPEIKARINDPVGPFNSPAIVNARSRAMLDVLLDAGADIDAKSTWWAGGFGLLHCASPDLADYAISRGANVDIHAAARLGKLDRVRELIAADPSLVHARGGDGQTPLHFAASVEIAELLLENGADIDALDLDHESTAAQWMIEDRQSIVRYLIGRGCKTDILQAAALGDIDRVEAMLDADPDSIRTRVSDEYFKLIGNDSGGTIYQWKLGWHVSAHQVARRFGHEEVVRLLFERSPDAIKLINACWMNEEAMVDEVRQRRPDIADDFSEADRKQAAHAARNHETNAVRMMLESGIPVDGRSQHQATPLHWAAFHGNREMTETILRFNPPLEIEDADHKGTPLGWAIYGSENGWYCDSGDYAGTVKALLAAGSAIPSSYGGTPAVREVLLNR